MEEIPRDAAAVPPLNARTPADSARVLHLAVVGSIVFWLVIWAVTREFVRPLPLGTEGRAWVRPVFLALMAIMTFLNVHAAQRMRDPERGSGESWWRENRGALTAAWASAEVTMIASIGLWYLHGFRGMPLMAGAWALVLVGIISRPSGLAEVKPA